ncbi:Zinc finger protein [Plakobranchus ocellatus]|uniref:Zinc finger protein n=1 Tax=Plakobranchus ocellatus TaxID=259542 RepID=A0AAV4A4V5_9GAST|nr:Zinc finger protein [Plakobranchus ocellatus]
MHILSDVFLNKDLSGETSFQYHYGMDLHNRIRKGRQLAQDSVRDSVDESRLRHEPKSKLKHFVPGNEVLVLLPTSDNKLVLSYKGPYKVVEKRTSVVYLVDLGDRKCTFHVNLLRNISVALTLLLLVITWLELTTHALVRHLLVRHHFVIRLYFLSVRLVQLSLP